MPAVNASPSTPLRARSSSSTARTAPGEALRVRAATSAVARSIAASQADRSPSGGSTGPPPAGLPVTEALWKTRPTVAGRVGGIVAQIQDGETGWLVESSTECAEACIEILRDPTGGRPGAVRGQGEVRP